MARKVKAVPMPDKYKRYMIIDENTGEILDDAQGYGSDRLCENGTP